MMAMPAYTYRVHETDPDSDPRWEQFVHAHPDALVAHHPAFVRCLQLEYGQPAVYLLCEGEDGNIRGVLPLLYTRPLPVRLGVRGRRTLCSLPRTPTAGPLSVDAGATDALVQAAMERVRGDSGTRLEIRTSTGDLERVAGLTRRTVNPIYVLPLPDQGSELRFGPSRNHGAIKRAVNKAERLGVRVRPAETETELRAWYQLYLETVSWHSRRYALFARSYRFFRLCWEELRPLGLMQLLIAERYEAGRSRILAGSVYFVFGSTSTYAFNGRHLEDLDARPNDALHWYAIHEAWRAGRQFYDFGEVPGDNEGLARFKAKWGAEIRHQVRYGYPAAPPSGQSDGEGSLRAIMNATWWRLPPEVATRLGTWLYGYL